MKNKQRKETATKRMRRLEKEKIKRQEKLSNAHEGARRIRLEKKVFINLLQEQLKPQQNVKLAKKRIAILNPCPEPWKSKAMETSAEREVRLENDQREVRLENDRHFKSTSRAMETSAEREARLEHDRHSKSTSRAKETSAEREVRLENDRHFKSTSRAMETSAEREARLEHDRHSKSTSRAKETSAEREARLEHDRNFKSTSRAMETSAEHKSRLENDRHFKSKSRAIETAAGRKIRLEKDRLRILKGNADISTVTNTINTYCDSICEICTKKTYPNQVTTYRVSTSKAPYLPAELAQKTPLLLCHRCNKHVNSSKQTPPSKAYWNSLDPGAIPEVILQLFQPEQRLLSRIIPFVKIVRYSGRFEQYG
ncbi:hypothetical protein LAZ67_12001037 [Cordylochernes scorpioides]|uniref:Uncharacterized protein n=1 Tax=Cordylochernes scorpioides TaxID=51811 RepID=A0ABY6L0Z9_9ARAC|nr:hypothetical protein LAZ67_12001037 [Cordylochernes scorpioides]